MTTPPFRAETISGYRWHSSTLGCAHAYLLKPVFDIVERQAKLSQTKRIFDLGCGNGSVAAELCKMGFTVSGVDPSEEGIKLANESYPHLDLRPGSAYDPLPERYGKFPMVLSLEVVKHVYHPRRYASCIYELLEENRIAILSTPYHGYLKNLAMALTGKLDDHFTALWDYGHIKFWSEKTLALLLKEAGFRSVEFMRVGRIPVLAKAMIAVAQK